MNIVKIKPAKITKGIVVSVACCLLSMLFVAAVPGLIGAYVSGLFWGFGACCYLVQR